MTTRRAGTQDILHGVRIDDPYRWLEDASDPAVRAWMSEWNAAARVHLHATPDRDALKRRLHELIYVDGVGAPIRRGPRWFFMCAPKDREKAVLFVKDGEDGAPRVLLDPNRMSADGSISLGVWVPSWDGERVAFTLSENAADESTLHLMDVTTGERSPIDVIPGAKYAQPSWLPDGSGYFYTRLPLDPSITPAARPGFAEIRFHRLGDDPALDPLVRTRTDDPTCFLGAAVSRDGGWLFTVIWRGWSQNDVWVEPLAEDGTAVGPRRALAVGRRAHFDVFAHAGRFYVHTDEGAPRGRVFEVDPAALERERWREIIPQDPEAVIEHCSIVGGRIAISAMRRASSEIRLYALDGAFLRTLPLPSIGTSSGLIGNPEDERAAFTFSSYTRPTEIHTTSIANGESALEVKVDVPGLDPERFSVEQRHYASRDGTPITMFLVRRRDFPEGPRPTLLYGYGGFNVSLTPAFGPRNYAWIEKGGVFAVPNLRGGGEYGEAWHEAGMLANKQNVFDDFIAAAEYLIDERLTTPAQLAIEGHSNGGLLMGAAITQRPELFRAVICGVPLLDMIRYHRFGSGQTWIPEYGNADDPEAFKTLLAYSPLHRVQAGSRYPALLLLSADTDDRVDPMHARKFAAAIEHAGGRVLLRIEEKAGHGGADLRRARVEEGADVLGFLCAELGLR